MSNSLWLKLTPEPTVKAWLNLSFGWESLLDLREQPRWNLVWLPWLPYHGCHTNHGIMAYQRWLAHHGTLWQPVGGAQSEWQGKVAVELPVFDIDESNSRLGVGTVHRCDAPQVVKHCLGQNSSLVIIHNIAFIELKHNAHFPSTESTLGVHWIPLEEKAAEVKFHYYVWNSI